MSRTMLSAVVIPSLIVIFGNASVKADNSSVDASLIKQGEYLVAAANCVSCHTEPGGARFAGGVEFNTAFGKMYSTNITPDVESGIGGWTETQFRIAMREGIRPNGEHLYPSFPYTAFTKLTDTDVRAMFAYLKTVPAVRAEPRTNELSFPFNQRGLIAAWKFLFFDETRHSPAPDRSAEFNRGAYLVEALGHCGACHTPRNFLGAERASLALSGGT